MSRRPRIKDIAERLGVSPATVSRALTGTGLVAEPTLSRIRQTAAALNYRPNVRARNLRTQRSMAIVMVVRDVGNPFYLDVFKGLEAPARQAGYTVLMGNTEDDPAREAEYFAMLEDGHADGMILMTGKLPSEYDESEGRQPVVVALEMVEASGFPHVVIDNRAAAHQAVTHLIDLGHRRIAHIAGPLPEPMSQRRMAGYCQAMTQAGLTVPGGYVQRGDFSFASGQASAAALMALDDPPTAIFAANDEMAFGAIGQLQQSRLRVPDHVSVVGFDDLFFAGIFQPPLTTVRQPRQEIGQRAMSILLSMLAGAPAPPGPVVMATTLQIRATTAPPPTMPTRRTR